MPDYAALALGETLADIQTCMVEGTISNAASLLEYVDSTATSTNYSADRLRSTYPVVWINTNFNHWDAARTADLGKKKAYYWSVQCRGAGLLRGWFINSFTDADPFNLAMSALYVYDLCDHGKRTSQVQKAAHSLLWSWDKKRNRWTGPKPF